MSYTQKSNPFYHQGRISDPAQFIGRTAEIGQITHLLRTMQSVSLVGEPRIGKSSLLYYIFRQGKHLIDEDTTVAYVDFRGVKDEPSFYELCCQAMHDADNGIEFNNAKPVIEYRLRDLETAAANHHVVLCFDRFEEVLKSTTFPRPFFDSLRAFADSDNVALLIASEHSLADLANENDPAHAKSILTSPFFGIFRRIDLGLFTSTEAEEFISTRFASVDVQVTEVENNRLIRLAGRFPFYLQLACYRLCEMKIGRAMEWERAFKRDAGDHLRLLWNKLKPSAQTTLRRLIDREMYSPDKRVIEDLAMRGLVVPDDKMPYGMAGFCEAFEDIVLDPPSEPIQDRRWRWWQKIALWFKSVEIGKDTKVTFERPSGKAKSEDKQ